MIELIKDLNTAFNKAKDKVPITTPSIPILYFGDYEAYNNSDIKIITVGLNPSHKEFPQYSRFSRFPDSEKLDTTKQWSRSDQETYLTSLNNYFKTYPYNWFDSFEPLLNGMHTSYYDDEEPNTALHTDLCSPFATNITWSKLSVRHKNLLRRDGVKIWHSLIEKLKPDLIMISVARKYLSSIRFRSSSWKKYTTIYEKKDGSLRSKPYHVEVAESNIGDKKGYLVFGEAAQLPFGTLSSGHKGIIGGRLLDLYD